MLLKFRPFFNGVWVESDYINDIITTKSPAQSSAKLAFISAFLIDIPDVSADSIHIQCSLGNHEGYDFILYTKEGREKNSLLTSIDDFENEGQYELGYFISKADTILVLYHYGADKKLIDQKEYSRYPEMNSPNDLEANFQSVINKELMTGSYIVIDPDGKKKDIQMASDGSIRGLPLFNTYYIITDFAADEEEKKDKICFSLYAKNKECYNFKIDGDTINIFKTPDQENSGFSADTVMYKFIKQK